MRISSSRFSRLLGAASPLIVLWTVFLDTSYVGTRMKKLPIDLDINNVPRAGREKAIARLGGNPTYLSTTLPNPFINAPPELRALLAGTVLEPARVRRDQLRPYPQFQGITMNRANLGSASYDALEMTANRRFAQGLEIFLLIYRKVWNIWVLRTVIADGMRMG